MGQVASGMRSPFWGEDQKLCISEGHHHSSKVTRERELRGLNAAIPTEPASKQEPIYRVLLWGDTQRKVRYPQLSALTRENNSPHGAGGLGKALGQGECDKICACVHLRGPGQGLKAWEKFKGSPSVT